MNELMGELGRALQYDMLSFVPELLTTVIVMFVTFYVFRLALRIKLILGPGTMLIGYGMIFLLVLSLVSTIADFPGFDGPIMELLFEISLLGTGICMLLGVQKLYMDVIGKQKDIQTPAVNVIATGEIK